ncbi:MAG TPA: glycosyltransferase family 39 protein [Bryobacteraceae bacterium]|nr:glycosyltransferase family 39 protein [Bryobacteraceae bacterium]
MRIPWLPVLWACFLLRLLFYSSMLPLWEGYDEWAHFAVVRSVASGQLLPPRDGPVPRDVEASLQIAPVPWEMRYLPPPSVSEDAFWTLPEAARVGRQAAFRAMPAAWSRETAAGGLRAYEALQPPLYYWLMAPLMRLASGLGLAWQVLALRWAAALIASLAVPLVFALGKLVFADRGAALASAAVVALMPGMALDVARVSNDCLAVVLFTLLTVWAVAAARDGSKESVRRDWLLGLVLGLGLLTKAYFLTAVPALALVLGRRCWRPFLAAAAVAGWWYVRNLATTGTLTGLSESVMLRDLGVWGVLRRAPSLPWRTAADAILFSHLYFGGWSSLTVRSWMYHLFFAVVLAAAIGLAWRWRERPIRVLAALYAAFWLGEFYNALLEWLSKGLPGSMGWYLYAVVGAEVVLCVAGIAALLPQRFRGWTAPVGALLFALFDLYTVHLVAIPYYSGMIRHKPNGAPGTFHLADFRAVGWSGAFHRLSAFQALPEAALVMLWAAYLAATALALAAAFRSGRRANQPAAGGK